VHPTPTQVLLITTLRPWVGQCFGALVHGVRLLDQFLHDKLTPQKMAGVSERSASCCGRLVDVL